MDALTFGDVIRWPGYRDLFMILTCGTVHCWVVCLYAGAASPFYASEPYYVGRTYHWTTTSLARSELVEEV